MNPKRDAWECMIECLEAMLSYTVEVGDETSKLQNRRYERARAKLDELKDLVLGSDE